jgi:hypothetical protein
MKILNPLYDWSLKYLLDNNELAKKFLSSLLQIKIIHLETRSIELPYLKDGKRFVSRFDFKAIIETNDKITKEVLLEIQKYRYPDPINRFRTYLGENYKKEETYKDSEGNTRTESLPLIALYILGYCPAEFDRPYIIVRNDVYDGVDGTKLNINSPTIDLLTHSAYFITATPPPTYKWRGSQQEAIIRLFQQKIRKEQSNITYELEQEPQDPLVKEISSYLNRGTQEEEIIKQLDAEEEYYESIIELEAALEQSKKREEETKKIAEQERKQKEEERRQKEKAKKREEQERRQKEEAKVKLAQKMKKYGESIEDIMRETGLSKEEIEKL